MVGTWCGLVGFTTWILIKVIATQIIPPRPNCAIPRVSNFPLVFNAMTLVCIFVRLLRACALHKEKEGQQGPALALAPLTWGAWDGEPPSQRVLSTPAFPVLLLPISCRAARAGAVQWQIRAEIERARHQTETQI